MKIDSTEFGSITVNGTTYTHDILIQLSGEVVKRKKKLSKKHYGTSHIISLEEAAFDFKKGCDTLVLGSGQYGNVKLSPEAADFFRTSWLPGDPEAYPGCNRELQQNPTQGQGNRPFPCHLLSHCQT